MTTLGKSHKDAQVPEKHSGCRSNATHRARFGLARLLIIAGCPIKHASKLEPSGYCAKTWHPAAFARWPVAMAARLAAGMSLNTLRDAKGRLQWLHM